MDYMLEMVQFPVTDIDRAKAFHLDQTGCALVLDSEVPKESGRPGAGATARPARSAWA